MIRAMLLRIFLTALILSQAVPGADFYVAVNGSDKNLGTLASPFATLERARDAVRQSAKAGGTTVWLRGGVYYRGTTFELGMQDSGLPNAPVAYRAYRNEPVRIVAGVLAKASAASIVTEPAVLQRLDPTARGKVLQLDLSALGVRHTGPFADRFSDGGGIFQLYFDGKRLPIARWPDRGYVAMARVTDNGDWVDGPNRRGGTFAFSGDRPARWLKAVEEGLWLDGFWRVPWTTEKVRIKSIDLDKKLITHAVPVQGGIGSKYKRTGDGKEPWYALNLLEELDRPGEWVVNFKTKTLYLWPPAALRDGSILISDLDTALFAFKGTTHVQLQGLTFEGGLGNGVEITGGEFNLVAGCTFNNLGQTGVVINGGHDNGVTSSNFHGLGHGGIYISGGERRTLTHARNFATNNHIHHIGEVRRTYAPAIQLAFARGTSVGNIVAHNLMHDLPHAAVLYSGNDNLLEFNEVHNVALDSGDVGAFYTVNDWTSRGNMLRYNFVHHSTAANAFYMDDGDAGDTIFGNVIYSTAYGPFIGGGHDNTVKNNIVIASQRGLHVDARGVARHYDLTDRHKLGLLNSVDYKNEPWSTRYPQLVHLLESPNLALPVGNTLEQNVLVDCPEPLHLSDKEQLRFSKIENNLILKMEEAGFVNAAALDFRVKPGAALYQRLPGFQPIPFEKIGLQLDAYRLRLPSAAETGRNSDRRLDAAFDSDVDRKASDKK